MNTLTIIRQIIAEKREKKIAPCYALWMEVLKRSTDPRTNVEADIAELLEFGMIISHPTIQDTAYELNNE